MRIYEQISQGWKLIPCIAYCVEKYDYDDEIVIVPVSEVIEKSQRGGIFTVSEDRGDFKYDFNKVTGKAVPNGALTRSFFMWKILVVFPKILKLHMNSSVYSQSM